MNLIPRSDLQVRLRALGGRPTPDRRLWVIRPDDLLVLDFELVNLAVHPGEGEVAGATGEERRRPGVSHRHFSAAASRRDRVLHDGPELRHRQSQSRGSGQGQDRQRHRGPGTRTDPGGRVGLVAARVPRSGRSAADRLEPRVAAARRCARSSSASRPTRCRARPGGSGRARSLGPLLETATLGKFAVAIAMDAGGTKVSAAPRAASALRPDAGVIAASRARRQLRVGARALGITEATGSATLGLHDVARRVDHRGGDKAVPSAPRTAAALAHRNGARDSLRAVSVAASPCRLAARARAVHFATGRIPSSGTPASAPAQRTAPRRKVRAIRAPCALSGPRPAWRRSRRHGASRCRRRVTRTSRIACRWTRSTATTSSISPRISGCSIRLLQESLLRAGPDRRQAARAVLARRLVRFARRVGRPAARTVGRGMAPPGDARSRSLRANRVPRTAVPVGPPRVGGEGD